MNLLRVIVLAYACVLPGLVVACCRPAPGDACCSEESACPIAGGEECALSHVTPTAHVALERDPGVAPVVLPTGAVPAPACVAPAFCPDPGPPRAAPPGFALPLRI